MDTRFDPSNLHLGRPLQVRAEPDGTITGLASVFDQADSYGDKVQKGAFAKSLNQYRSKGRKIPMLWSHDVSKPVGVWSDLRETDEGLVATGKLNLKTSGGSDAFHHVQDGSVSGLSIGFRIPKGGASFDDGFRQVSEVDLAEISLVVMPAADGARISEVRSQADLRELLREGGLAARAAKKAASVAWPVIEGEDPATVEARHAAEEQTAFLKIIAAEIRKTAQKV